MSITKAYLVRDELRTEDIPDLKIERRANGKVYVCGPTDRVNEYKNQTKGPKKIRRKIATLRKLPPIKGITSHRKGDIVRVYGKEDDVIKCIQDLTENKFIKMKDNLKYSSVTYRTEPTKYTKDLDPFLNSIARTSETVVNEQLERYKGIKVQLKINYVMSKVIITEGGGSPQKGV